MRRIRATLRLCAAPAIASSCRRASKRGRLRPGELRHGPDGSIALTPKVFTKLLGLFVLLLVFQTVVMEFVFGRLVEHTAGESVHLMAHEALWAGIIALVLA